MDVFSLLLLLVVSELSLVYLNHRRISSVSIDHLVDRLHYTEEEVNGVVCCLIIHIQFSVDSTGIHNWLEWKYSYSTLKISSTEFPPPSYHLSLANISVAIKIPCRKQENEKIEWIWWKFCFFFLHDDLPLKAKFIALLPPSIVISCRRRAFNCCNAIKIHIISNLCNNWDDKLFYSSARDHAIRP